MSDIDPRDAEQGSPSGRQIARARVLSAVAEALSSTDDVERALRGVAEATVPGLADRAWIERAPPGGPTRRVAVRSARAVPRTEPEHAARPIEDDDDDLADCARRAATSGELAREAARVGAPLVDHEGVVGALALARRADGTPFDDDDLALVREIARRVGIALRAARALERVEEAERALRTRSERDRLATEAMRGVVYEWDAATDEVSCSRGLLELAGFAPSDARSMRSGAWRERVHEGDRRRVVSTWRDAIRRGARALELVYRIQDRHGAWRHVWDRARIVRDESGRVVRAIGGLLDVSDRVRAQQALEHADRRKDELIALLGHELRGPLAAIAGAVEVLERFAGDDAPVERARAVLRRQVAIGTRLAEDLLDASRIAKGKMTLRIESLDLDELVADVVDDHRAVVERHGLALALERAPEPVRVHGDRTRLAQALGNVLHNAIKFSDPGGEIGVRVAVEDLRAVVVVRDDGIGIAPEMLGRVFEPFAQAEVDPDRAAPAGLGLGLALVRGVIELHRGRAEARSEGRGRGTEVRLELPIDASERSRASSVPPPRGAPIDRVRVLVVEDDQDAAEMLQILLESEGQTVLVVAHGPAALAAAEREPPDLVLCDLGLPGAMSGHEVAAALRRSAVTSHAYLVALSGFGDDEARERAARAGFDRHLTKPADAARLRECVQLAAARRERARI